MGFAASMRSQEILRESHLLEEHPFLLLSKFSQRHADQSKVEVNRAGFGGGSNS